MSNRSSRTAGLAAVALAVCLVAASCGGHGASSKGGAGTASTGGAKKTASLKLSLDWVPNPDHVGLYYALERGYFDRAGLKVSMKAPSDPSAPIKLVGLNKVDLAISYEPEVFFAAEKHIPAIAVAAIVQVPLNSIIALRDSGITTPASLEGHSVGITGIPTDNALVATIRGFGHIDNLKTVTVGYSLVPSLLSHKVDSIIGGYRNVEAIQIAQETGKQPVVIPVDHAGVPSYDELVLLANKKRLSSDPEYAAAVRRFISAYVRATDAAAKDPGAGVQIMKQVSTYKLPFLQRSVPATLGLVTSGPSSTGCMSEGAWENFGGWMHRTGLIKSNVPVRDVMTTAYLPGGC